MNNQYVVSAWQPVCISLANGLSAYKRVQRCDYLHTPILPYPVQWQYADAIFR